MRTLLLILSLLAAPVAAQQFPAIYSVAEDGAADRIPVYADRDEAARQIGSYPPYAVGIEVLRIAQGGAWAQVGWGEVNGWIRTDRITRDPDLPPGEFPLQLVCSGVEPSWRIGLYPGGLEYDSMATGRRDLTALQMRTAENGFFASFEEGPTLNRHLTVRRARCTDTMSDRRYGWEGLLFTDAPDGSYVEAGCCTMEQSGP